MDEMTQRNSVMADQSAEVAQELQQATNALEQMVAGFIVDVGVNRDLAANMAAEIRQIAPQMTRTAVASKSRLPLRLLSRDQLSWPSAVISGRASEPGGISG